MSFFAIREIYISFGKGRFEMESVSLQSILNTGKESFPHGESRRIIEGREELSIFSIGSRHEIPQHLSVSFRESGIVLAIRGATVRKFQSLPLLICHGSQYVFCLAHLKGSYYGFGFESMSFLLKSVKYMDWSSERKSAIRTVNELTAEHSMATVNFTRGNHDTLHASILAKCHMTGTECVRTNVEVNGGWPFGWLKDFWNPLANQDDIPFITGHPAIGAITSHYAYK